jgi:hypothetical protein
MTREGYDGCGGLHLSGEDPVGGGRRRCGLQDPASTVTAVSQSNRVQPRTLDFFVKTLRCQP